jgi:hypothetical protein
VTIFHAILVSLGLFRHIHTRGSHPWIKDPAVAAFLVNPTSIKEWAGDDASHIARKLKLHEHDGGKDLYSSQGRPRKTGIDHGGQPTGQISVRLLTSLPPFPYTNRLHASSEAY